MGDTREVESWRDDLLVAGANRLGLKLEPAQVAAFGQYLAEILRWSRRINLTGLDGPEAIVREGFLDSLGCLALLPAEAYHVLDIGPGAGFPSLPLKIVRSRLVVTLVESSRKKASFLRHVIRCLRLEGMRVVQERAEQLAEVPVEAGAYDVTFARAVAPPEEQVRLAFPFLRPGGLFLAQVGNAPRLLEGERWGAAGALALAGSIVLPREVGRPERRILALRRCA